MSDDTYEIFAVKYAHHHRRSPENFIGGDPHDVPMPLDYFVWAIRNASRTVIVDTGFTKEMAKRRGRDHIRAPGDGLKMIGIDPGSVEDVVISHMHYDHAGGLDDFPHARFHIQDREMEFCTGRCMCHANLRQTFEADDVVTMVRRVFDGRVQFHDGVSELTPGITLHLIGGHALGLQAVRVKTRRGHVVLASDASHFYANYEQGRPFPIVASVPETLEGYRTIQALASSPRHIIPGHDPLVMARYPAAAPGLEGIVARLDADPAG